MLPTQTIFNSLRFRYSTMMYREVQNCARRRTDETWCSMTNDCKGWGCRLIRIFPASIPETERERGKLFSKVYTEAENLGVLDCPFYHSTIIDEVVESRSALTSIMAQK